MGEGGVVVSCKVGLLQGRYTVLHNKESFPHFCVLLYVAAGFMQLGSIVPGFRNYQRVWLCPLYVYSIIHADIFIHALYAPGVMPSDFLNNRTK